jgi:hypothetical protein
MADLIFFNVSDGYSEAFVRGLRKGILGEQTYTALKNCSNARDLKAVK